jgi:receptor protein-tyrosine kinase
MNIIEQATQRLEQLRDAGVAVPWSATQQPAPVAPPASRSPEAPAFAATPAPVAAAVPLRPQRAASLPEPLALDLQRLADMGYVVPDQPRSAVSEEFRHIKRPLLRHMRVAADDPRASLLMVTSALPGEGKTFCAINLAMSIAMEVDASVLLIDGDVVRPAVFDRLGLQAGPGLLDALADPTRSVDEFVVRTNLPKLSLLSAGRPSSHANELLASARMEALLAELGARSRQQIVVIDSPPLLLTAEARALAARVGQVLVTVQAERTPREAVNLAFAALEQCENVNAILNRSRAPSDLHPNGYGYGYYY